MLRKELHIPLLTTMLCVSIAWAGGSGSEPGGSSSPAAATDVKTCPLKKDTTKDSSKTTPKPKPSGTVTPARPTPEPAKNCVYSHSGEHYVQAVDVHVPGRGLPFTWARKYRSQLGPVTALGNGWDYSYNIYLQQAGPDLDLHDGNTRVDRYFWDGIETWTCPEFFRVIRSEPDLSYTVVFPDTGQWRFFPFDGAPWAGKIQSIIDRNGNEVMFEYDGLGRLQTVWDTLGRPFNIGYNPEGFIETVTDFTGREVRYEYYGEGEELGSFGDLRSVTTPAVLGTPTGNDFPDGKTTAYTYTTGFFDDALNHDLLTITAPLGQTYLQNVYAHTIDATDPRYTVDPLDPYYGRLVRQLWGEPDDTIDLAYADLVPGPENNFATFKAIINDRVGNVEEHFYDDGNRMVMLHEYTGRAPDPDALTTDVYNRPVAQLRPDDPPLFETRYEFNADAQITYIMHPNGNAETFLYDSTNPERRSQGNLLEHCWMPGPLGGDQPLICEFFEYEGGFGGGCCGSNFVTRHVDGRGNETLHSYDGNGNREHTTHPIASIVEDWEYNGFGQVTAHVLPDNGSGHRRRDEYTYYETGPQMGYLHQTIVDVGGFALTTTYEYDSVGNIIRTVDARGYDTLRDVNQLDQIVREQSREVELGSGVRYETLYYYDANDNIVRVDVANVDEAGAVQPNAYYTSDYEYDPLNRLSRSTYEVSEGDSVVIESEYDANGNRVLARGGRATSGADPDNVAEYVYDERDLLYQVIHAPGSPVQSTTQTDYDGNRNRTMLYEGLEDAPRTTVDTYDGYNRPVSTVDPMGNVTTRHFDANHNLESSLIEGELVDVPGGAGNVRLWETNYTYDGLDRRIVTDIAHFDSATQVPIGDGVSTTTTDYSDNSQVIRQVDDNARETLFMYDTACRLLARVDAAGNTRTYTYDGNGNVLTLAETELSDLGEPDEIYYTNYTYDGLDRRIRTENNIGVAVSAGYDSRGNTTLEIDASLYENRYTYDGLDRRIGTIHDMDGDGADGDGDDIVLVETWDASMNPDSRIDGLGNVSDYEYDPLNRLIRETTADGMQHTYEYDPHNNVSATIDANGSAVTYEYDSLNRLIGTIVAPAPSVLPDTTYETYQYDGLSRLVLAEDDDVSVDRMHDSLGNVLVEVLNGQATTATYDGESNQLTCTYPGGRGITCAYDALNRKQMISDDVGGMVASYSYVGPDRVRQRLHGNGTQVDYQYDGILPNPPGDMGERQIVRTTHSASVGGAILDNRTYTWDASQNKTQRSDVRPDGPMLVHDYAYDPIYRLRQTVVTGTAGVVRDEAYDLDGAGGRTHVTGGNRPGQYQCDGTLPEPADCQMNQYTQTPMDGRDYDANGNLIGIRQCRGGADSNCDGLVNVFDIDPFVVALTQGQAGWEALFGGLGCDFFAENDMNCDGRVNSFDIDLFVEVLTGQEPPLDAQIGYDFRDRMVEYTDLRIGKRHTYSYDPLGRRIGRIVDADGTPAETTYFYNDWQVVEEHAADGSTQATYVYGGYVDEVLTMSRAGLGDYYYHGDDLDNVVALSSAAGHVVERYDYGDYGEPSFTANVQAPDLLELYDSDAESGPTTVQVIAERFTLPKHAYITELRWWGGYSYDPSVPETDSFRLTLYADDGGVPGAILIQEWVGDDVNRRQTGRLIASGEGDVDEYAYSVVLPDEFLASAGVPYWLEIRNDTVEHPSTWGWETGAGGDGTFVYSHDAGAWTPFAADTAFELVVEESLLDNPYLFTGRRYDTESGWYHYRTRYLDPLAGRFTTRDPVGIWGDPVNLGAGHTYVGNNPWTRVDPYGEITVTRHGNLTQYTCGGFDVKWVFKLDKPSKCNGYIVQKVDYRRTIAPCGGAPKKESKTYWEAWYLKKGAQTEELHAQYQWTDNAAEPSHPATCGKVRQDGEIKFFCLKKTGDLGRQSRKPTKPNDGWAPGDQGGVPMAGALPSTTTRPKWWAGASANGEKAASRWAKSEWDCCKTPPENKAEANP